MRESHEGGRGGREKIRRKNGGGESRRNFSLAYARDLRISFNISRFRAARDNLGGGGEREKDSAARITLLFVSYRTAALQREISRVIQFRLATHLRESNYDRACEVEFLTGRRYMDITPERGRDFSSLRDGVLLAREETR